MPIFFHFSSPPDTYKRLAAWREHYVAKGCSAAKAAECAKRKRYSGTWPKVA